MTSPPRTTPPRTTPPFVGPHEARDLELMRQGLKPLSMVFAEKGLERFAEADFDAMVADGLLLKRVAKRKMLTPDRPIRLRLVLYALPAEAWRLDAMIHLQDLYSTLGGWRFDIERVIGSLLGYDPDDVERWIDWLQRRQADQAVATGG